MEEMVLRSTRRCASCGLALLCVLVLVGWSPAVAQSPTGKCWSPIGEQTIGLTESCPASNITQPFLQTRIDHFLPFSVGSTSQWIIVAATNGIYRLNQDLTVQNELNLIQNFTTACPFRREVIQFLCTSTMSVFQIIPGSPDLYYCDSNFDFPKCSFMDVLNWSPVAQGKYTMLDGAGANVRYDAQIPFTFLPAYDTYPIPLTSYVDPQRGLFVALSEQQRISRYNNQNTPKVVTATPKQAQDLFVAKGASAQPVGSFALNGKWFIFANTLSSFADNSQTPVFGSYVGRVCMDSPGQPSTDPAQYNNFNNILKAQILCRATQKGTVGASIVERYDFTNVVSIDPADDYVGNRGTSVVYAAFTVSPTARNSGTQTGAAVCRYTQTRSSDSIELAFEAPAELYRDATITSDTCTAPTTANLLKKTIMNSQAPLYVSQTDVLTAIGVTECKALTKNAFFNVMVMAHVNGSLTKLLLFPSKVGHVIETFQAVTVKGTFDQIKSIKFVDDVITSTASIYARTQTQLMKFPMARCSLRKTCTECVGMRDPFCGWYQGSCNTNPSGLQSVSVYDVSGCPIGPVDYHILNVSSADVNTTAAVIRINTTVPVPTGNYSLPVFDVHVNDQLIMTVNTSTVTITGLAIFTKYSVYIIPRNNAGAGARSPVVSFTTDQSAPEAAVPSLATHVVGSQVSITVGWTRPRLFGYLSHYLVSFSLSASGPYTPLRTLPSNTTDLFVETAHFGVKPATRYFYVVETCNSPAGLCSRSVPVNTTTPCIPPAVPTGLQSLSAEPHNVTVAWVIPSGATNFRLFFHPSMVPVDGCCSASVNKSIVTGLQALTSYQFVLQVASCGGYSPLTAPLTVTTTDGPPPAPTLSPPVFNVDNPTTPQVSLQWTVEQGRVLGTLLPIKICRTPIFSSGSSCISLAGASDRSYNDTDVFNSTTTSSSCTRFQYTVVTATSFGERRSESRSVHVGAEPPPVVSLTASPATANQIVVSWSPPNFAPCRIREYQLNKITSTGSTRVCCTGPQTQFVDNMLLPSTQYTYSVRPVSYYTGTVRNAVTMASATTLTARPDEPSTFLSSIVNNDIMLTWSTPSNPNGPILNYTVTRDGSLVGSSGQQTSFSESLNGLQGGWSYVYAVTAHTSAGPGLSAFLTVNTPPKLPAAPQAVHITVTGYTSAVISWVPPVYRGNLQNYEVIIYQGKDATNPGTPEQTTQLMGNDTLLTVQGLTTGRPYFCTVTAISSAGRSTAASSPVATLPLKLADIYVPQNFVMSVQARVPFSLIVSWSAANATDVLRYNLTIQRSDLTAGHGVLPSLICCTAPWTSFEATQLDGAMDYTFSLTAILTDGTQMTNVATARGRTLPSIPSPPQSFRVTSVGTTSANLTWLGPMALNGQYDYSQVLLNDVVVQNTTQRTAHVAGLKAFTTYEFRVRAVNTGPFVGSPSQVVTVTTTQGLPSAPLAVTACGINKTTMAVRWTEPVTPNGPVGSYDVWVSPIASNGACDYTSEETQKSTSLGMNRLALVGGLSENTPYCARVRCSNTGGFTGPWSGNSRSVTRNDDATWDCVSLSTPPPTPPATDEPTVNTEERTEPVVGGPTTAPDSTGTIIVAALAAIFGVVAVTLAIIFYKSRTDYQKQLGAIGPAEKSLAPVSFDDPPAGGNGDITFNGAAVGFRPAGPGATSSLPSTKGDTNLQYLYNTLQQDPAINEVTQDADYEPMPQDMPPMQGPPAIVTANEPELPQPRQLPGGPDNRVIGDYETPIEDKEVFAEESEYDDIKVPPPPVGQGEAEDKLRELPLNNNLPRDQAPSGDLYTQTSHSRLPSDGPSRSVDRSMSLYSTGSRVSDTANLLTK